MVMGDDVIAEFFTLPMVGQMNVTKIGHKFPLTYFIDYSTHIHVVI